MRQSDISVSTSSAAVASLRAPARLVGAAPAFQRVLSVVPALARADGVVLLTGEAGTGKSIIARAIHDHGPRVARPFIAVHCGALVDSRLESQLFGQERGADTDADDQPPGLVAQAHGGTLFLDEIEALSPHGQGVLLRLLQEGTFRPLGSTTERNVDVRFIAATHVELRDLVRTRQFRADLYHRLCGFSVVLPALRHRRDDILPLAWHFATKHGPRDGPAPRLSLAAAVALLAYGWPGNVCELENAILRALGVVQNGIVEAADLGLPRAIPLFVPQAVKESKAYREQRRKVLAAFDRQYLVHIVAERHGTLPPAECEPRRRRFRS